MYRADDRFLLRGGEIFMRRRHERQGLVLCQKPAWRWWKVGSILKVSDLIFWPGCF
jgi:hypothetical protein